MTAGVTEQLAARIVDVLAAMPTCASCQHWRNRERPWGDYERRICDLLTQNHHFDPDDGSSPVHHEDSSEYESWIETKPDFGCKAWEPRG